MKNILLATVSIIYLAAAGASFAAEQTVTMDIEKMTCALCPLTVRKAMERVDGVKEVNAFVPWQAVSVEFVR